MRQYIEYFVVGLSESHDSDFDSELMLLVSAPYSMCSQTKDKLGDLNKDSSNRLKLLEYRGLADTSTVPPTTLQPRMEADRGI